MYLRTKSQVSSIILTSFRQGVKIPNVGGCCQKVFHYFFDNKTEVVYFKVYSYIEANLGLECQQIYLKSRNGVVGVEVFHKRRPSRTKQKV